jgi:hypothetical protein
MNMKVNGSTALEAVTTTGEDMADCDELVCALVYC